METVKIGLLHSLSGTMSFSETPLADAARMAIDEINSQGGVLGLKIEYLMEDGESSPHVFAEKATQLIDKEKVVSIFGGWNSHTRKSVKTVVERKDSLFWYPMSYEGLEESPNIFYTGSSINQQVIPAVEWCLAEGRRSFYLLGSDYIFPITTNKLIRSLLTSLDAEICEESYLPLGHRDFDDTMRDIEKKRPDILINTLNGDSNFHFFDAFEKAGLNAARLPILSSSIAEPESKRIGAPSVGHYACWTYFQSLRNPDNLAFCEKYRSRYGRDRVVSDPIAMAYAQLFMWKQIVEAAGSFAVDKVNAAAVGQKFKTPAGEVQMCPNRHVTKKAYIGQVESPGEYKVVWESPGYVEPRPWLGVEQLQFGSVHLVRDIMSRFPDVVDFNQSLRRAVEEKTSALAIASDKLHQAQKMQAIGRLAGGIAHDFNNIIGAILGFSDLMLDEIEEGSELRRYAENILNAGERAKKLVSQILSFSRKTTQRMTPMHFAPLIEETASLLRATLPAGVEIRVNLAPETAPVSASDTMIQEVLINIATNAAHAMDASGRLTITLKEQYNAMPLWGRDGEIPPNFYTIIEIADEGEGMSKEVLEQAFEPFFSTKETGKGTGLGLSVVYGIVKNHGGYIQVDTAPGQGAAFRLFFPKSDQPVPREESMPMVAPGAMETKSILLVDDEIMLLNVGTQLFRSMGHRVTACVSPKEASVLFRKNPNTFDLVVTDQAMPEISGLALAKEILEHRPKMPIILCTGYNSKVDRQRASEIGIRAFLQKPIRKKEWAQTFQSIFGEA